MESTESTATHNDDPTLKDDSSIKKRSFDDYQILRDLGQGAYGKVYLAKDRLTDKIVALKSVNKQQIL